MNADGMTSPRPVTPRAITSSPRKLPVASHLRWKYGSNSPSQCGEIRSSGNVWYGRIDIVRLRAESPDCRAQLRSVSSFGACKDVNAEGVCIAPQTLFRSVQPPSR